MKKLLFLLIFLSSVCSAQVYRQPTVPEMKSIQVNNRLITTEVVTGAFSAGCYGLTMVYACEYYQNCKTWCNTQLERQRNLVFITAGVGTVSLLSTYFIDRFRRRLEFPKNTFYLKTYPSGIILEF